MASLFRSGPSTLLLAVLAATGCASSKNSRDAGWRDPVVVAHRGGSGHAPENTLAAYRRALALGAQAAECDVRMSADGEVVLMHDRTVTRTTDGRGAVARMRWPELSGLDAGGSHAQVWRGESVPRLEEVLDLVAGRLVLFVELKAGDGLVEAVSELIARRPDQRSEIVLMSFDAEMVRRARDLLPDVPRILLLRRPRVGQFRRSLVARARAAGASAVGLHRSGVGAPAIEAAHEAGLPVFVYTVNSQREAVALVRIGVDGIISDFPDRVADVLGTPTHAGVQSSPTLARLAAGTR